MYLTYSIPKVSDHLGEPKFGHATDLYLFLMATIGTAGTTVRSCSFRWKPLATFESYVNKLT